METKGDIFLLRDDNSICENFNKNYYNYELRCLKRYLLLEGFSELKENFIITFFDKKWLCKPSYFKEFETFKGIKLD